MTSQKTKELLELYGILLENIEDPDTVAIEKLEEILQGTPLKFAGENLEIQSAKNGELTLHSPAKTLKVDLHQTQGEVTLEGFNPEDYNRGSAMDNSAFSTVNPGTPVVVMEALLSKEGEIIPAGSRGIIKEMFTPAGTHSLSFQVQLEDGKTVEKSATCFGYPK